eukprot:scaffold122_cov236-Pinguiococcus_pyrenoidosus.AAC.13
MSQPEESARCVVLGRCEAVFEGEPTRRNAEPLPACIAGRNCIYFLNKLFSRKPLIFSSYFCDFDVSRSNPMPCAVLVSHPLACPDSELPSMRPETYLRQLQASPRSTAAQLLGLVVLIAGIQPGVILGDSRSSETNTGKTTGACLTPSARWRYSPGVALQYPAGERSLAASEVDGQPPPLPGPSQPPVARGSCQGSLSVDASAAVERHLQSANPPKKLSPQMVPKRSP